MFIDAHAHLDKYGRRLDAALEEIERLGVLTLAVAMDPPSYFETEAIAARCGLVVPSFGVHPKRAPEYAARLKELGPLIEKSPMIGEVGLDFHWVEDGAQYPAQRKVLDYFLAAAREQDKIVNLHTKGAEREILDLLERHDIRRAIVHWYSGPGDILRGLADFGAYLTVGVEALYSEAIREIARAVPDHLLLTETDNPGGLQWLAETAGMPGAVQDVVQALADLRGAAPAGLAATIEENFFRLIRNDPGLGNLAGALDRRLR